MLDRSGPWAGLRAKHSRRWWIGACGVALGGAGVAFVDCGGSASGPPPTGASSAGASGGEAGVSGDEAGASSGSASSSGSGASSSGAAGSSGTSSGALDDSGSDAPSGSGGGRATQSVLQRGNDLYRRATFVQPGLLAGNVARMAPDTTFDTNATFPASGNPQNQGMASVL